MSIERDFDIPLIASLALREKQIQQNYRPLIAVHKWFARRPGSLFRGLLLAEFGSGPLSETYFRPNRFPGKRVADPFMGGGTPLVEANRVGCDVLGMDINPMATWIVREQIEHLDLREYRAEAQILVERLKSHVEALYKTRCPIYGTEDVPVKYFLWVKTLDCLECGIEFDLFPGYLIADDTRHPRNVLVCRHCGELNESESLKDPGKCTSCSSVLRVDGPAKRNRCKCPQCGHENRFPRPASGPLRHRLFAIEYYNPQHKQLHKGRFFKRPDDDDLKRAELASSKLASSTAQAIPDDAIPAGDETDRLHRWGYRNYKQLFNDRQLLGLEVSCRLIREVSNPRVRAALATNLSDLLRYQNMLCRYDTMALKSLDIFSIHGFPVGLVQCESNLLGITNGNGGGVGSGGWTNIIEKYFKAKSYCDEPFEVRQNGSKKVQIPMVGEWIGEERSGSSPRYVELHCKSATDWDVAHGSLDAVFTDPPYFGNVQYGELMDFCYVWLRKLIGNGASGFSRGSTRSPDELTENVTALRGIEHFTEGLSVVYSKMARGLKPGAPLAFTYHHNKLDAYIPIGVAILDSGLNCLASIPCPAEMGGSIHIHGTGSSIIDTVFVCRAHGAEPLTNFKTPDELGKIVANEIKQLKTAGVKPTEGDIRCICFGHLVRMAVFNLRPSWSEGPVKEKISRFEKELAELGSVEEAIQATRKYTSEASPPSQLIVEEEAATLDRTHALAL